MSTIFGTAEKNEEIAIVKRLQKKKKNTHTQD